MVASSGARLLEDDAVDALVAPLFPLATVVTPNLLEARALAGRRATRRELAERLVALGAPAAIVTGGHGDDRSTISSTAREHLEIPVERLDVRARRTAPAARTRRRSPRCSPAACRSSRPRAAPLASRPKRFATAWPSSARATAPSTSST